MKHSICNVVAVNFSAHEFQMSVIDWMSVYPEIHVLIPNPKCDGIWRGSFGGWLCHESGDLMNGISAFVKGPQRTPFSLALWKDTGRRQPSVSQKAGSHQTLSMPVPWPWPSQPPSCMKSVLFISHSVCDITDNVYLKLETKNNLKKCFCHWGGKKAVANTLIKKNLSKYNLIGLKNNTDCDLIYSLHLRIWST